jgi:hypothetical protein
MKMYNIEITNMYRNDGMGYADDTFPMYYYKITCKDVVVEETDWHYGFSDDDMASDYMNAYYPGEHFTITVSE